MPPELHHAPPLVTQHLLYAREKAVGSGTQLRLAIDPDGPIARSLNSPASAATSQAYATIQRAPTATPPASPAGSL